VLLFESPLGRFAEDIGNCSINEGRRDLGNTQPGWV
jgi:hypothetical protein